MLRLISSRFRPGAHSTGQRLKHTRWLPQDRGRVRIHISSSLRSQSFRHDDSSVDGSNSSASASSTPADGPQENAQHHSSQSLPPHSGAGSRVDFGAVQTWLRSWAGDTAISLRSRTDRYTASAITSFAQLGRELNRVTGYEEIEALKRKVVTQEACIQHVRSTARDAKLEYERAVQQRAQSQREVNDLLQRKSSWTDDDVGRFTALVRQDHLFEQAESRAKQAVQTTEDAVEREFTELMRVILHRYHEEQVWSDKIRSASTYGSLTVLGLNVLVFILAITVVEPWKRKRLAQTFERKVQEMSSSTVTAFESKVQLLLTRMEQQDKHIFKLSETMAVPAQSSGALEHADVAHAGSMDGNNFLSDIHWGHVWIWTISTTVTGIAGWVVGYYLSN
ncbi:hypothetical protein BDW22DRAFT_1418073 [Trametopsis cervina]|nr:hypothetical protein BDW22DRAFT_1418073 [Trametopsis cervina]